MQPLKVVNSFHPILGAGSRARFFPPPYSPARRHPHTTMMSNRGPSLGEFSMDRLPISILATTGGIAAFFLGGALPAPGDTIAKALGVASVGFGIYWLFSKTTAEKRQDEAAMSPEARAIPGRTPAASAFSLITGAFQAPAPMSEVPAISYLFGFFGQTYNGTVIWYNNSEDQVQFSYDIFAIEKPIGPMGGIGAANTGIVYPAQTVKLDPQGNTGPINVKIKLLSDLSIVNPRAGVETQLQLRKYDSKGNPVVVAKSHFYVVKG